ncbi:MAG TPA: DUF2971 domain-containing protein [Nitrososphaera sp.]|nr:DUF2971 domain-containing protein [Nitrososphaera sp.]
MSLYKYVIAERIDILRNARIRFTQPSAFNDPFEMRPFIESFTKEIPTGLDRSQERASMEETYLDLKRGMEKQSPEAYSLLCKMEKIVPSAIEELLNMSFDQLVEMCERDEAKEWFRTNFLREFNNRVGVLCLTEKCDNLLMWAHYTNNHQGFVIQFDENHPYFHISQGLPNEYGYIDLRKVQYSVERPNLASLSELSNGKWYLCKGNEWEYEQEWRMLRRLDEAEQVIVQDEGNIYLFSLPPASVRGVILGCRMSEKRKTEILEFLRNDGRYSHVKTSQAVMDDRGYVLSIVPNEI